MPSFSMLGLKVNASSARNAASTSHTRTSSSVCFKRPKLTEGLRGGTQRSLAADYGGQARSADSVDGKRQPDTGNATSDDDVECASGIRVAPTVEDRGVRAVWFP